MTIGQLLRYYMVWGLIGCAAFSVFVLVVFKTGMVWAARDDSGQLKQKQDWRGILAMVTVPVGIAALYLLSNGLGLASLDVPLNFVELWLLNYGYYVILFIYDTFVIDYLLLSIWRPAFLDLPDNMNKASMSEHIWKSIPVGLLAGLLLSVVGTLLSYMVLF